MTSITRVTVIITKETTTICGVHLHFCCCCHRLASKGRSVAPRWPQRTARLLRSAGGRLLSCRIWSTHLLRGQPGWRCHLHLHFWAIDNQWICLVCQGTEWKPSGHGEDCHVTDRTTVLSVVLQLGTLYQQPFEDRSPRLTNFHDLYIKWRPTCDNVV